MKEVNNEMNSEKLCFASKAIEVSESDSYLTLTNMLCYYDEPNLNNVMLPYSGVEESAKEMASTLVNQPVQAKYKKTKNGDDFGGHELSVDKNGKVVWGTTSIGTHTKSWIENCDVTTVNGENKNLPCLFAESRIWKRNSNVINAIKRLFESEDGLNTSWEISTNAYEYKDGIKKLTDYEFIGNAILGSNVTPAYKGTSKTLSIASEMMDGELMIAEALALDMSNVDVLDIEKNKKEELVLEETNVNLSSNESEVNSEEVTATTDETIKTPVAEETSVEPNAETPVEETFESEEAKKENTSEDDKTKSETSEVDISSLTVYDLMRKIGKACDEKMTESWAYPVFIYPADHYVLCDYGRKESEMDYLKFNYEVNGDNVNIIGEAEKVTLVAIPKEINSVVAEFEAKISEKDNLITTVSAELTNLKTQIAELTPYKEKFEKAEQERIEAETAQKKEDLIASVVKSGQITREEIESSEEMTEWVNTLNKQAFMSVIGERVMASIETKETKEVETSEIKETVNVATNLNSEDDETPLSEKEKASIVRRSLYK